MASYRPPMFFSEIFRNFNLERMEATTDSNSNMMQPDDSFQVTKGTSIIISIF